MVGRNMSLKNPVTPPGIDPGSVRVEEQRLNHYATPGSFYNRVDCENFLYLVYIKQFRNLAT
jgi:hypothetical protein